MPAVGETAGDAGAWLLYHAESDSCARLSLNRLRAAHALTAVNVAINEVGSLGCDIAFARAAT